MKHRRIAVTLLLPLSIVVGIGCNPTGTPPKNETAVIEVVDVDRGTTPKAVTQVPSMEPVTELPTAYPDDESIRLLAWNIESDGSHSNVIAEELQALPRYDVYGFSEVRPTDFPFIKEALGQSYECNYTESGYDDRLAYAIRKSRFEIVDQYEMDRFEEHVLNPGNYRSPYVTELRDKKSNQTMTVMLNHLARGKAEIRQMQAEGLRQWAKSLGQQPLIAIGDYNFDYVFATAKGNRAMDVFLQDAVYKWVRPEPMVDSNWFDGNRDGVDDYPGSLLDFAFVSGIAKNWDVHCRVIVRAMDFPDDPMRSDHRPIELTITPRKQAASGK